MATVTSLGGAFTTTAGDKVRTATPALNDLIVIVTESNVVTSLADNNSDGLGTYTGIVTFGTEQKIWIRDALIGSATSTVFTSTQTSSNGGGLQVFAVSGMSRTGASAARQSKSKNDTSAATPNVVMDAAALTGNALITMLHNTSNPATVTEPSGWSEGIDTGFNTPATGVETAFINSGFAAATITWGSSSATNWDIVCVELDTSAASSSISFEVGAILF